MNKKYITGSVLTLMVAAALLTAVPALAQADAGGGQGGHLGWFTSIIAKIKGVFAHKDESANGRLAFGWGITGTVSSVGTSTILVNASSTSYTVDASQAKVYKGSATSTAAVSDIAVGDMVTVKGKVDGTSVSAALILDGVNGFDRESGMMFERFASTTRQFMGSSTRPFMGSSTRPFMRDDREGGDGWQGVRGPQGPMDDRGQRPESDR